MDVLGYLKSRQNELERIEHPFSKKNVTFRYAYAYGIAVMALGNMKAITELQDRFDFFLECISLPKEQRDKLQGDINNFFEFRLSDTIKCLKTKEMQYCFFADLYKLSEYALWSKEYCEKIIENYQQIFHTTQMEILFFEQFNQAAVKKQLVKAQELYAEFRKNGYDISYSILQYFYKDFFMEDYYENLTVELGKTVVLDKPTVIAGDIRVERGGSLLIDGAQLKVKGAVFVDGGRIRIRSSKIEVVQCQKEVFLTIRNAAVTKILNSTINCNFQCGFLSQDSGSLFIDETEFVKSRDSRMIEFSGNSGKIMHCSFAEGEDGFVKVSKSAQMEIEQCDFYAAKADYGGAFFSDSIDNVIISQSAFRSCDAKYLGAAIYFQHQKLGQFVKDCICKNCQPQDSAVFYVNEDDFLSRVGKEML